MQSLIIYSSLTGNTQKLAKAIYEIMPENSSIYPVDKAPDPNGPDFKNYDLILLGFWVRKAAPDSKMGQYMQKISNKNLAFFGTLGAYPNSNHAKKTILTTEEMLSENKVWGNFLCQGKVSEKLINRMAANNRLKKSHPLTPERIAQRAEAAKHPNEEDFKAAQKYFQNLLQEVKEFYEA